MVRSAGHHLLELALQRIQQERWLLHLEFLQVELNLTLSRNLGLQRRTMGTGMSAGTRRQRRPTASLNPKNCQAPRNAP